MASLATNVEQQGEEQQGTKNSIGFKTLYLLGDGDINFALGDPFADIIGDELIFSNTIFIASFLIMKFPLYNQRAWRIVFNFFKSPNTIFFPILF